MERSSCLLKTCASQLGHFVQASEGAVRRLKGNLIGNRGSFALSLEEPMGRAPRAVPVAPGGERSDTHAHRRRSDGSGDEEPRWMAQDPGKRVPTRRGIRESGLESCFEARRDDGNRERGLQIRAEHDQRREGGVERGACRGDSGGGSGKEAVERLVEARGG